MILTSGIKFSMVFKKILFLALIAFIGCSKNPESVVNEYIDACRNDDLVAVYKMLCDEDRKSISLQSFVSLVSVKKYENYEASLSSKYEFVETIVIKKNEFESEVFKLISLPGHNSQVGPNEKLYFKGLSIAKVVKQSDEYKIKLHLDMLDRHNELRKEIKESMIGFVITSFEVPRYGRDDVFIDIKFMVDNITKYSIKNPVIRFFIKKYGRNIKTFLLDETITLQGSVRGNSTRNFWSEVYNKDYIFKRWFKYYVHTEYIDGELDTEGKIELEKFLINKTDILGITNYYDNIPILMNLRKDIDLI